MTTCGLRKYAGEQELVWGGDGCEHQWRVESQKVKEAVGNWQQAENGRGLASGVPQTRFRGDTNAAGERKETMILRSTCLRCGAWRGAYGLEPAIEMYVAHTVEILGEIKRVLRPDGVVFWNIGDSYSSGGRVGHGTRIGCKRESNRGTLGTDFRPPCDEIKPKDLCLIPSRVALAAQADGWWVRSMIVWAKPNPMPESVTDRPTDAYEHIIMLTKSARYFWDADAVRELCQSGPSDIRKMQESLPRIGGKHKVLDDSLSKASAATNIGQKRAVGGTRVCGNIPGRDAGGAACNDPDQLYRNLRNVWTFATQPYSGAHFATFPEELPRRCIQAATSAKGACIQCGAPWERVSRENREPRGDSFGRKDVGKYDHGQAGSAYMQATNSQTVGWRPTCLCRGQHGKTQPCLVLDPFGGSGTTGQVAIELRRRCVLMDLAYAHDYGPLAVKRTTNVQMEAFA